MPVTGTVSNAPDGWPSAAGGLPLLALGVSVDWLIERQRGQGLDRDGCACHLTFFFTITAAKSEQMRIFD